MFKNNKKLIIPVIIIIILTIILMLKFFNNTKTISYKGKNYIVPNKYEYTISKDDELIIKNKKNLIATISIFAKDTPGIYQNLDEAYEFFKGIENQNKLEITNIADIKVLYFVYSSQNIELYIFETLDNSYCLLKIENPKNKNIIKDFITSFYKSTDNK